MNMELNQHQLSCSDYKCHLVLIQTENVLFSNLSIKRKSSLETYQDYFQIKL